MCEKSQKVENLKKQEAEIEYKKEVEAIKTKQNHFYSIETPILMDQLQQIFEKRIVNSQLYLNKFAEKNVLLSKKYSKIFENLIKNSIETIDLKSDTQIFIEQNLNNQICLPPIIEFQPFPKDSSFLPKDSLSTNSPSKIIPSSNSTLNVTFSSDKNPPSSSSDGNENEQQSSRKISKENLFQKSSSSMQLLDTFFPPSNTLTSPSSTGSNLLPPPPSENVFKPKSARSNSLFSHNSYHPSNLFSFKSSRTSPPSPKLELLESKKKKKKKLKKKKNSFKSNSYHEKNIENQDRFKIENKNDEISQQIEEDFKNLTKLLKDEIGRNYFLDFLIQTQSSENLLFWIEIETFRVFFFYF